MANDEYRRIRYESYVREKAGWDSLRFQLSARYEKAILTIAGGSLGLSITFVEKIASKPEPWTLILLGVAWLCLVTTLLVELVTLDWSQKATTFSLEIEVESYHTYLARCAKEDAVTKGESAAKFIAQPDEASGESFEKKLENLKSKISACNRFGLGTLIFGIVGLCLFSIFNLNSLSNNSRTTIKEANMSDNNKNTNTPKIINVNRGRPPIGDAQSSYIPPGNTLPPPEPTNTAPSPQPTTPAPKPNDSNSNN